MTGSKAGWEARPVVIDVADSNQRVSGVLLEPEDSWLLFVLAHGAGAGMRHSFMEDLASGLATRGIATLRYQFPYMDQGRRRPDPAHLLEATVRSAVGVAARSREDLPLVAGGKSMGGRMTSQAQARAPLESARGLVFVGFPLHRRGRPDDRRAEHLRKVNLPMLFLQGTRDRLADLELLEPVCHRLGPGARLHVVEGADHGFAVLKRSGRTAAEVFSELAEAIAVWGHDLIATS